MKLFQRRKPENAEEEDDLLLDTDAAEDDSIREVTEAATGASTDPPAEAGAVPPADDPLAQMRADAAAEAGAVPPADDPLAQMRADAAAEAAAAENPPEGAPASPQPVDALNASLMDLFRDAKNEVEETTLASQLPDIPIQDLLSDLENVSQCLGITPRVRVDPRRDDARDRSGKDRASRK